MIFIQKIIHVALNLRRFSKYFSFFRHIKMNVVHDGQIFQAKTDKFSYKEKFTAQLIIICSIAFIVNFLAYLNKFANIRMPCIKRVVYSHFECEFQYEMLRNRRYMSQNFHNFIIIFN